MPETNEIVNILRKYRGLREQDLSTNAPLKSCVICSKKGCGYLGDKNNSCDEYVPSTEEQFAVRYDFKEENEENR